MSRFLRICAFLFVSLISTNLFAAGYTCSTSTVMYTSCDSGYFMLSTDTLADCLLGGTPCDWDGIVQANNRCAECTMAPNNAIACPGGTDAPVYQISLNTNGSTTIGTFLYSNSAGFCTGNTSNATECKAGSSTVITKIPELPTKTGYIFKGYYTGLFDGTQTIDENGNILADAATLSGHQTWYAQFTAQPMTTISLNATYYASETATSGTAPSTNVAPRSLYYFKDTGMFTTNQLTSAQINKLTTLPVQSNGAKFMGFYTGKAGTGTKTVDASGNILFENIVNAGLYTTAGTATWYAHYQSTMSCVPLPIYTRTGGSNYSQRGIVYMKPGEPLVYSNATCTTQITQLPSAILTNIKSALGSAQIAGLYLGVEPLTAPLPFNAKYQNPNLIYTNKLDTDYMAGTDYARKGYNYPADADGVQEFATPSARVRNFMFNSAGALAYPNGHPTLSVLGPDVRTPIYVWSIVPPQNSTYTTLVELLDVTGTITGSTSKPSGRFKYVTTCPSGYVQTNEPGTAYSTCTNEIFTIAYSGNKQTSGSAPTSPTACAAGDETCVAPANTYTKTGHTFAGWTCTGGNSSCDGDVIQPGDSLGDVASVGGAITLTAKWTPNTYTVNVTNIYGDGYVVYKGTTYNGPDSFSFTCQYGEIVTLPEWGENNTLIRDGYIFTGWGSNSFSCTGSITRVTPIWTAPRCTAGTGTASTELLGVISNTAYCSCSNQAGYYCPSQMAGEQGVAAVTVNANPCPNGKYCQAGLPFPEACPVGSYSEFTSASTRCIVCSAGTTTADQSTGPDVGCTATCPNSDNVSTWATPSWDANNNTVTNICSVSTCNETSILVNNTCGACTCVAGDNSTCTVKPSDQTNNLCMYEVTCNPGYIGATNQPGVPGVTNNNLPACTAITYTVKFNANGGTGTMADQSFKYDAAQNLTANAFARTGYTFKGWSLTEGSNTVAYGDKQSAQNMTKTDGATVNLYAVWAANCNAITLNPNNGTAGTTATLYKMTDNTKWYTDGKCTDELQSDDHATLIPTRNGYTFRGFYLASSVADVTATQTGSCTSRYITHGGSTTSTGNGWNPTASATLMAGWAKNCAPGTNATCTLTIDQCVTYATSCATGYDISNSGAYNPTCSAHPYTITYNLMGGTNNASNPATYTIESATITLANPTRANSTFAGWYTESSYTNKITQIVKGSTGNKPVYAKWTCNTGYTENSAKTACNPNVTGKITLDSTQYASSTATSGTAATTAATPTPLYIKYNTGVYSDSAATTSVAKITAPVLTGHSFLGFYTGKAGTGDLVVNPDGTFVNNIKTKYSAAGTTATWYAHYEPWTYKIVYNAWKPDTASSTLVGETSEQDATYGVPIAMKTQQDAGFELTGYDLIGWANSEANARIGAVSNSLGQVVSKPNMPENGYVFNMYPVWVAKTITLDWDENNGNAITNGSCKYDSTFTLPAGPTRTNYTFRIWQLANQSEQFPTTTQPCTVASFGAIDENNTAHGVRALWKGEKATVTFKTGNTVLDTKQYEYGTTYTLPDISGMSYVPANLTNASYGWTFVGWSTDYNSTSAEYANKASVTNLTGAITLYPVWKRSVKFTYYKGSTATTTTTDSVDQYYRNTTDTAAGVTSVTTPTAAANTTYGWVAVSWELNNTSNSVTNTVLAKGVSPAVNTVSPHYYAVYRRSITLSYNGNGSTGGSVGSSANYQYYNAGGNGSNVAFTVASNGFTKTGHTFQGWAKTATGTDEFQPGDTYTYTNTGWTGSSTATLYAKWNPNSYRITLNNTTATSAVGVRQTLYTTYDDGVYLDSMHTKRMTTNGNPIAQLPSRQYTITYSSNGSTSTATAKYNFIGYATSDVSGLTAANTAINSQGYITSVGSAAAKSYTDNDHVWAVNWDDAGCVSLHTPANRTGYTFAGWYTSEDFTDYDFVGKANATYCPTSTITLYGKWEPNVYTVTLADSVLDTTHNTIYEKYNTGWYSNAGATTKITSVPKPTRSGIDPHTGAEINYVFLGYFTTPQEDVYSTNNAPASLQRVDKNGNILPSNTSLTGNTTWYAAWAEPCANVPHGTCYLSVSLDGSTEYTGECEEGYIPNGYGGAHPTCGGQMVTLVSDFNFHGETLNAMTVASPKVIYLKPNDGFYTTSTGSTPVTYLTNLPELEHRCFTFNGFYTDPAATSIKRINADGTFVDNYEMLPTGPEGSFLYAGYTANSFSFSYDLNGGEEEDDGEFNVSLAYSICNFKMGDCHASQGSTFKKDGYTLTGWKCYGGGTTACDGSDDDIYAPGAVITHVSNSCAHNPTFVAQWKPIESTITLDKNNVGSTDTNTGNGIIYTKYDWGAYLDSALTNDMSQTLRPITIPTKVFTVKYNANNDGTSPSTSNVAYTFKGYYSNRYGVNKYIDENGYITTAGINEAKATVTPGTWYANWTSKSIELPKVTRTGYQFSGWYKCSDTNQTIITSPFTPTENTELCAKWTPNTYTVTFNANGATGTMNAQTMTYDVPAALTAEGFTNPGCKFTGWATSASGDVVYSDKQTVSNLTATQNGTVDLYAKWNCMTISASNKTLTYNGTSTTNGTAQSCQVVPTVSNAPSNITVTYSINQNSGFSATAPTLTNVSSGRIYYKVSATGYDDWIDSYTCTMQAKNMTVVANNITLPYTEEPQSCANVKVTDPTDGKITYSESANGPFDGSTPSMLDAGTKTIYYQVTGANYNTKTGSYTCTIEPTTNPIILSATSGSVAYGATTTFNVTKNPSGGALSVSTSNSKVATATINGTTVTVTGVGYDTNGTATITVTSAETSNYLSASATYTVTVNTGTILLKNDATTAGTTTIYTKYNTGVYNDSARKNAMSTSANGITIPAKAGYVFNGYYSATSGGTQYIDANGKITSNGLTAGKGYKTNGTWHAQWSQASCTVGTGVASATASVTNNIVTCAVTCSTGYSQTGGTNTTTTFNNIGSVNVATVATACSPRTFAIEYAGNTNTGGSAPTSPVSCTYDATCTAPDNKYTKTGYTFTGWKCTGGTSACDGDIISAGGSLKNVSTGSTITLTAQWTANSNTKYVVNHYTKNLGATTYTLNSTENKTGTSDASLTLANLKKSITGFTYSEGFAGTATKGTTKPSSGAVTSTTILANGTRVIDLYYNRNTYTITATAGHGVSTVSANGWTNTGTATMTKSFEYGAEINLANTISANNKTGYTGKSYANSGTGTVSNGIFTVGNGAGTITVSATGIAAPTATITPASTDKIYNLSATTLTGANNTAYDSAIKVYYNFGNSSSSTGTYTYGTAGTTATTSVAANAYRGVKYYKVKIYATDGTLESATTESSAASVTLDNKAITFNATSGTLSGTSPLYVSYNNASVYTGSRNTTAGTVPTATKTGYTFNGWYTAETGGSQIYNASGTLTSATVSGYTSGSKWVATGAKTLYAQWTANSNTKYVVNHYTKNLGATTYTLNSTENKTGTSDSSLTLANLKKSITGFTYSEGFAGTATKGTTKPTSGAVTTTTILPGGTRVIDLYYNRVITTVTISKNSASGSLTVNNTTATSTNNVVFTCEYGATFTLPAWGGSANALALTKKVFTGWDKTGTITCGTANQTITAQWTTPTCTAGTGVNTTSLKEVTNNAPVCNRSSKCGYYCSATQTGTAGATSMTTTCTKTDAGYYAAAGATAQTKADAGYYAAAGACSQTAISQGCFGGEGSSVACPNQCPAAETGWTLTSTTGLKVVTDCTETTTPATSGSPIATICTAGTLTKKATSTTAWGVATANGLKAKSGRYVNGLTCSACTAGYYQGTNGSTATACTPADAGYYVPSAESDKQTACPAGTYQGSTGKTSCTDATAGTYTTGCKITSNSTACTGTSVCEPNTYSNDKASTCTACATDKGYGNSGTSAADHAGEVSCKVTCSAGTAVLTANNACASIQNSTYKGQYTTEHLVSYGSKTEIQTCPPYYQDGNGTTAQLNCINACSAGTQVASANADCTTPNTANWYTDAHNVTYGKTSSNMSKVIDCATDKGYGNSGTSASNHAGSTSCKTTCAAGKMVLSANAACSTPNNTTYGASWYTAQHTVAYGSTSKGLSLVKSCPTSSYVTPNDTTQSNHNDSTDCTITCEAGTVVASSNANCTTPSGSWYSGKHTVVAGSTSSSAQKQPCVNGYATPNTTTQSNHDDKTDCTITCGPGEYVAAANGLCENVGAGYYFAGGKVSQGSTNTRGQCTAPLTTIGYGYGANEAADCGRILHAGNNTVYLRSAERTSPSLRVKVGDTTFYGALSTSLSGALKVKKDNIQYSVVNDWQ